MKIIVTGGAGFIGSHVVDAFVAAGHQVIVLDDLSAGKREQVNPAARLVEMSIADPAVVDLFQAEKPDLVNHHAANPSVSLSVRRPDFDARQNILGTINLLEASRLSGAGKFVYICSGGAMYGNPQRLPVDEEHPAEPVSPYGLSKHTGERYVRLYGAEHGLRWTSLRYANVYGPRQDPCGEAGVISVFCQNLLDGAPHVLRRQAPGQNQRQGEGPTNRRGDAPVDADPRARGHLLGAGVQVSVPIDVEVRVGSSVHAGWPWVISHIPIAGFHQNARHRIALVHMEVFLIRWV